MNYKSIHISVSSGSFPSLMLSWIGIGSSHILVVHVFIPWLILFPLDCLLDFLLAQWAVSSHLQPFDEAAPVENVFAFKFHTFLTFFICVMAHCANFPLRQHPSLEFKKIQLSDCDKLKAVSFLYQKADEIHEFLCLN